jgi:hypothetical protein
MRPSERMRQHLTQPKADSGPCVRCGERPRWATCAYCLSCAEKLIKRGVKVSIR